MKCGYKYKGIYRKQVILATHVYEHEAHVCDCLLPKSLWAQYNWNWQLPSGLLKGFCLTEKSVWTQIMNYKVQVSYGVLFLTVLILDIRASILLLFLFSKNATFAAQVRLIPYILSP